MKKLLVGIMVFLLAIGIILPNTAEANSNYYLKNNTLYNQKTNKLAKGKVWHLRNLYENGKLAKGIDVFDTYLFKDGKMDTRDWVLYKGKLYHKGALYLEPMLYKGTYYYIGRAAKANDRYGYYKEGVGMTYMKGQKINKEGFYKNKQTGYLTYNGAPYTGLYNKHFYDEGNYSNNGYDYNGDFIDWFSSSDGKTTYVHLRLNYDTNQLYKEQTKVAGGAKIANMFPLIDWGERIEENNGYIIKLTNTSYSKTYTFTFSYLLDDGKKITFKKKIKTASKKTLTNSTYKKLYTEFNSKIKTDYSLIDPYAFSGKKSASYYRKSSVKIPNKLSETVFNETESLNDTLDVIFKYPNTLVFF